jgi:hypothetical protein
METKHQLRKDTPVYMGVLMYFPDAINAIARCSKAGNDQHNPNTPLHWDRSKSGDEMDALMRHAMETGTMDDDDILHSTKVAWRALAQLQKELETTGQAPRSIFNGMTAEEAVEHYLTTQEPTLLEQSDYGEGIIDGTPISDLVAEDSSS